MNNMIKRDWGVLLLGGASGVGKSCVSYKLAHKYEVGIIEVDDFQVILENMTKEEEYPVVHFWKNHFEEAIRLSENEKLDVMIRYAAVMATALEHVIANHLESNRPVIIEGDFIVPALCSMQKFGEIEANGRVKGLFVLEEDERQIRENYFAREGDHQGDRARVSYLYNEWLKREAAVHNAYTVAARPWTDGLERIDRILNG